MQSDGSNRMLRVTIKGFVVLALVVGCPSLLGGCAGVSQPLNPIDPELYPTGSTYIYQPLNPTTVWIGEPRNLEEGEKVGDETSKEFKEALLRDLDTETVRISLNTLDSDATATAAVVGVSAAGQSYQLILDYIKYLTVNKAVNIPDVCCDLDAEGDQYEGDETISLKTSYVPIYTGIGLRIRAEFKALKGGLNISGLPALAIAANANGISGRLTVQTLGITGQEITGLMPIISDISVASIQQAVQAVAAIKAKIYEESTVVYPKIVGFESPDNNPDNIRAIAEQLYRSEESISFIKFSQGETPARFWIDWSDFAPEEPEPEESEEPESDESEPEEEAPITE